MDFKSEKEKERRRGWGKEVKTIVVRGRVIYYNAREKRDARL